MRERETAKRESKTDISVIIQRKTFRETESETESCTGVAVEVFPRRLQRLTALHSYAQTRTHTAPALQHLKTEH